MASSYNFRIELFSYVLCSMSGFSVKIKLSVSLLCVCAILHGMAIPEMTYTVSSGTITHSINFHHIEITQIKKKLQKHTIDLLMTCGATFIRFG